MVISDQPAAGWRDVSCTEAFSVGLAGLSWGYVSSVICHPVVSCCLVTVSQTDPIKGNVILGGGGQCFSTVGLLLESQLHMSMEKGQLTK